MVCLKVFIGK